MLFIFKIKILKKREMGNNNGKGQEKKVNKFGFNGKTTAIEISQKFDDQQWKERVVLITGTTAGIGYETARAFALMKFPPTLIFANRNIQLSRDIAAKFIQLFVFFFLKSFLIVNYYVFYFH